MLIFLTSTASISLGDYSVQKECQVRY